MTTRYVMMALLLALLKTPAVAQDGYQVKSSYEFSDHLPLAVGNSWTYYHSFYGDFDLVPGIETNHPTWEASSDNQFTISVLRTEIIDGNTYYVLSEGPSEGWPPMPTHFIGGKKLRWNGNQLIEHDGTSEVALYRFKLGTQGQATGHDFSYTVSLGGGSEWIVGASSIASRVNAITQTHLTFIQEDSPDIDDMTFLTGYGMDRCSVFRSDEDYTYFANEVVAVEALIQDSDTEARSDSEQPTFHRIPFLDFWDLWSDGADDGSTTSASSSSWGSIKDRQER